MKEKEIKMIENLFPKKNNNKDYLKKLCDLLKKKDVNYSKKRKHLSKVKYSIDENNNLYLTLPNLEEKEENKDNKGNLNLNRQRSSLRADLDEETNNYKNNLKNLIPEFYDNNLNRSDEESYEEKYKFNDNSSVSSGKSLTELAKKELYEKLKTKPHFFEHESLNLNTIDVNSKISKNKKAFSSDKNWGNINSSLKTSVKSIFMPKFDEYDKESIILNMRKIREKLHIIDRVTNKKVKTKKIQTVDLYNYDPKKWHKINPKESDGVMNNIQNFENKRNKMVQKLWDAHIAASINAPRAKALSSFNVYSKSIVN